MKLAISQKKHLYQIIETSIVNFTIAPQVNVEAALSSCSQQNLFFTNKISLLKLAPNPTSTSTTIEFSDDNASATIEIYDLLGKKQAQYITKTQKGNWLFDSSNLPSGVYIVVFKNVLGFQSQQKLIKQ